MDWLTSLIVEGISKVFNKLATDIINKSFEFVAGFIIEPFDINKYFPLKELLMQLQIIAGSLLVLAVTYECFKQLSNETFNENEKSKSTICMQTVFAGTLIVLLPTKAIELLININNALIKLIQTTGKIKVETSSLQKGIMSTNLINTLPTLGLFMLILVIVLGIGFIILGIAGAIRYVELVFCTLIAPFVAVSFVRKGDMLEIWAKETVATVFTQSVHMLMLKMILGAIGNLTGLTMFTAVIGLLVVAVKAPTVLKTYLYSSGVGSATVNAVGGAGRMATYKYMMKSVSPVS